MTRLRQTIARRLKEAQNTAAMLTTFNEVDMSAVMAARAKYKDEFEKKNGVRLGFMSFFAKAVVIALKEIPSINAEIEGDQIVYRDYADTRRRRVSTEKGSSSRFSGRRQPCSPRSRRPSATSASARATAS